MERNRAAFLLVFIFAHWWRRGSNPNRAIEGNPRKPQSHVSSHWARWEAFVRNTSLLQQLHWLLTSNQMNFDCFWPFWVVQLVRSCTLTSSPSLATQSCYQVFAIKSLPPSFATKPLPPSPSLAPLWHTTPVMDPPLRQSEITQLRVD